MKWNTTVFGSGAFGEVIGLWGIRRFERTDENAELQVSILRARQNLVFWPGASQRSGGFPAKPNVPAAKCKGDSSLDVVGERCRCREGAAGPPDANRER